MAILFVQGVFNQQIGGSTQTITISPSIINNFLVIGMEPFGTNNTVSSVIDNKGNSYTQVSGAQGVFTGGPNLNSDLWYTQDNFGGVTSVTITYSGSGNFNGFVYEFSGIRRISPVDVSGNLSNQVGPCTGVPLTTSSSGELICQMVGPGSGFSTVDSPFTPNASGFVYAIVGSSGTYQPIFNPTTTQDFCASGVAFFPSPIARIQEASTSQSGVSSISASFGSGTAVGSLIVVGFTGIGPTTTVVSSITDDKGNSYSQVSGARADDTTFNFASDIWYAPSVASGTVMITANFNATVGLHTEVFIIEYSGAKASNPIDTSGHINTTTGAPVGPLLTISNANSVLVALAAPETVPITSVQSPWSTVQSQTNRVIADYLPGVTGTYQANFNPTTSQSFCSSGAAFLPAVALTVSLSDSVSSSDSTVKEDDKIVTDSITPSDLLGVGRGQSVSDSMTVTDSSPNSFSVQSSAIAPASIPEMEVLVNQLVPAEVKTFFEFE